MKSSVDGPKGSVRIPKGCCSDRVFDSLKDLRQDFLWQASGWKQV